MAAGALEQFISASQDGDRAALAGALSPDVEVVSPFVGRMVFRGREDVIALLGAVYDSLSGLEWYRRAGEAPFVVVMGRARIAGLLLEDAMVLELDAEGRVRRVRPHLRPLAAMLALLAPLLVRLAGRPGVFLRALR